MKYKAKNSGFGLVTLSAVDLTTVGAMLLFVVLAWGVAKMERSMIKPQIITPVFTIAESISVSPVVEAKTAKDAAKVGNFVSLGKSKEKTAVKSISSEKINNAALSKIIPDTRFPGVSTFGAPKIIYKTMPDYPIKAVEKGLSGLVVVRVYILKNGRVGQANVQNSSGYEILDRSALSAVSQWVFSPASVNKESSEAWFEVPVKFELRS